VSSRRLQLSFPDEDVSAAAVLLDEQAPETCAAIWQQLVQPLEMTGTHAMWTGPEVSLQIPPDVALAKLARLPAENLTVFPQPGDLVWAYMPGHAFRGIPFPIYDIGVFYGPQGRIFLPMGWFPCNHFAQLQGDWEKFGALCAQTLTEGAKRVRFERAS
jgi:hypothetical protein